MGRYDWLEVEGRRVRVAIARDRRGVWVGWPGASAFLKREEHIAGEGASDDRVAAPMTGKVVKVEVQAGDAVEEGALLVVLEAMKMEYRLTAPHGGRVAAVICTEGELVDLGATLVTLESG